MTADIYHFPGTEKEVNDQIDYSERPSNLTEALAHITRAQQPDHFWYHVCPGKRMFNTKLIDGQVCPFCGIDKNGDYHGRPDGAA